MPIPPSPPHSWPALYVGPEHDFYGMEGLADDPGGWDGSVYREWRFIADQEGSLERVPLEHLQALPVVRQEHEIRWR